jgi:hypothetical protein
VKHEQSLADCFNSYMRKVACELNKHVLSFALDGQDRVAGADYLLSDTSRFAMVEFKYLEGDLKSERFKPRRLALCKGLQLQVDMRDRHDLAHFIAWGSAIGGVESHRQSRHSGLLQINTYRNEICNCSVFGASCGLHRSPLESGRGRELAEAFATEFLTKDSRSLSLHEFEKYLAWVLEDTSESSSSTLELLISDPDFCCLVELNSIAEAHAWMQAHYPLSSALAPTPGSKLKMG